MWVQRIAGWIASQVLELSYTAYDLTGFAQDIGDNGPPFVWDNDRRAVLRAELDAAYFCDRNRKAVRDHLESAAW